MAPASDVEGFKQKLDVVKSAAKRAGRGDEQNFSATMFAAGHQPWPGGIARLGPRAEPDGSDGGVALHALWEASAVAAQLPSLPAVDLRKVS